MIYKVTVERKCSKCELVKLKTENLTEAQLKWLEEWESPDPWPCTRCKAEGTTEIKIVEIQEKEIKKVKGNMYPGSR